MDAQNRILESARGAERFSAVRARALHARNRENDGSPQLQTATSGVLENGRGPYPHFFKTIPFRGELR